LDELWQLAMKDKSVASHPNALQAVLAEFVKAT
jgi:hypothetical protein